MYHQRVPANGKGSDLDEDRIDIRKGQHVIRLLQKGTNRSGDRVQPACTDHFGIYIPHPPANCLCNAPLPGGGCSKGQDPACEKMIHSGGYQAVRRTSPRRNASGDTVHMKNASFGGRTLARDSTFGARSYAWEVLRSRATRCGSCTIPVSEHLPAYLSTLLSSTAAAGPPRRRADSGGRKRQIVR
jgi:hypothetical protein